MLSLKIFTRGTVLAMVAAAGLLAIPAHAKSYQTRITAFVPTNCSAGLNGSFSQISADSFSLGDVVQFCNTRFQLSLNHSALDANAQLSFGGSSVSIGQDTSVMKALANPTANSNDQIVLSGVDEAQAQEFGSSLTITISPIAF